MLFLFVCFWALLGKGRAENLPVVEMGLLGRKKEEELIIFARLFP
jgi:hypothetical protein